MQLTSPHPAYSRKNNREVKIALIIFSLCFLAGSVIGSAFDYSYPWLKYMADGYLYKNSTEMGPFISFLWSIRFHILAMLIGTSFLGMIFMPPLVFARAYLLSCASATIISAYPKNGIIMSLIIVGIPALFSVPTFFAISSDSLLASLDLLRMRTGTCFRTNRGRSRLVLICLIAMIICTFAEIKLVPYIILLLNK